VRGLGAQLAMLFGRPGPTFLPLILRSWKKMKRQRERKCRIMRHTTFLGGGYRQFPAVSGIHFSSKAFKPSPGPRTPPPIKFMAGSLSPGVKRSVRETDSSHQSTGEVTKALRLHDTFLGFATPRKKIYYYYYGL
jgi:hypothetical protein